MTEEAAASPVGQGGPLMVVLSGPSGVGKDVVVRHLRALPRPWHFVVTATTRPQRPAERDGVDYIFVDEARFAAMLSNGDLLEHAQVYGHWYGVPRAQVRDALQRGLDVFIKVDIQGATTIKRLVPQGVFIFLAPPSIEELERRLRQRKTESTQALEARLGMARREMEQLAFFDYVVVNENARAEEVATRIDAIVTAEKCRVQPRRVQI